MEMKTVKKSNRGMRHDHPQSKVEAEAMLSVKLSSSNTYLCLICSEVLVLS